MKQMLYRIFIFLLFTGPILEKNIFAFAMQQKKIIEVLNNAPAKQKFENFKNKFQQKLTQNIPSKKILGSTLLLTGCAGLALAAGYKFYTYATRPEPSAYQNKTEISFLSRYSINYLSPYEYKEAVIELFAAAYDSTIFNQCNTNTIIDFLARFPNILHTQSKDGKKTIMHIAAENNNTDFLEIILGTKHSKLKSRIIKATYAKDKAGLTPMETALKSGNELVFSTLYQKPYNQRFSKLLDETQQETLSTYIPDSYDSMKSIKQLYEIAIYSAIQTNNLDLLDIIQKKAKKSRENFAEFFAPCGSLEPPIRSIGLIRKQWGNYNLFLFALQHKSCSIVSHLFKMFGSKDSLSIIRAKGLRGYSPMAFAFYTKQGKEFCRQIAQNHVSYENIKEILADAYEWNKSYKPKNETLAEINTETTRETFWRELVEEFEQEEKKKKLNNILRSSVFRIADAIINSPAGKAAINEVENAFKRDLVNSIERNS